MAFSIAIEREWNRLSPVRVFQKLIQCVVNNVSADIMIKEPNWSSASRKSSGTAG
jgi:hypothetical protein